METVKVCWDQQNGSVSNEKMVLLWHHYKGSLFLRVHTVPLTVGFGLSAILLSLGCYQCINKCYYWFETVYQMNKEKARIFSVEDKSVLLISFKVLHCKSTFRIMSPVPPCSQNSKARHAWARWSTINVCKINHLSDLNTNGNAVSMKYQTSVRSFAK